MNLSNKFDSSLLRISATKSPCDEISRNHTERPEVGLIQRAVPVGSRSHTQGETIDGLIENIMEAIKLEMETGEVLAGYADAKFFGRRLKLIV